jgi:small subunit ribosomal protein S6
MREYEVTVLLQPKLDDEAQNELLERITGLLTHGDEEADQPVAHHWGRRNLAYLINDQKEGYYVHFEAKLEPGRIAQMERDFIYMDDVLRHLVVRKES